MNSKNDFTYGPITVGIYKALLWATLLVAITAPHIVLYYFLVLCFIGLFLKPLLIKTGITSFLNNIDSAHQAYQNVKARNAYHLRNEQSINSRNKKLSEMKNKLQGKSSR